jgi:tetratricopeptide (TPR) repeat protein
VTRALVLVALLVGSAHADVWQRAIDGPASLEAYENHLMRGDEAVLAASSRSSSLEVVKADLDIAIASYRVAAKANPKSPEPHFRIGTVLHTFFLDCHEIVGLAAAPPTCHERMDPARVRDIVEAWDAFERLAPLDPRVKEILFDRAVLRTKMVLADPTNRALLEGAKRDYRALLERADGLSQNTTPTVIGNLAETHMMLGELPEAIDTFRDALRAGGDTPTLYGLAVALDRDDSGQHAMKLIRDHGHQNYEAFVQRFRIGEVFYVPSGEEHYYFALAEEAFGNHDAAIRHWRLFLRSGAHPQFQPRAKEHLDALVGKKVRVSPGPRDLVR